MHHLASDYRLMLGYVIDIKVIDIKVIDIKVITINVIGINVIDIKIIVGITTFSNKMILLTQSDLWSGH